MSFNLPKRTSRWYAPSDLYFLVFSLRNGLAAAMGLIPLEMHRRLLRRPAPRHIPAALYPSDWRASRWQQLSNQGYA